ncbi:MAG: hypothetical protein U0P81_13720 [Holophagaceae bacterium]
MALARDYAEAAQQAGDAVTLHELEGTGHMAFLDPASLAHAAFCAWLEDVLRTLPSG